MKTLYLRHVASAIALAIPLSAFAQAGAVTECPMLPQAEVINAFDDPDMQLNMADPSGVCNWSLSNNDMLMATVMKRPDAAQARAIYDSYLKTSFAELKRNPSKPAIGERAYFGMSAKNAASKQAGLISLQGDTLIILQYTANDGLEDGIAGPLLALAQLASARKDNAAQSYGECEWFTPEELGSLLGKGKLTVQRMAENHCIASVTPSGAALTAATSKDASETALGNMKASEQRGCKVIDLPGLGTNAYATYACAAPANKALSLHFIKNGQQVMMIYAPPGRVANKSDVGAVEPIARRAYDRL